MDVEANGSLFLHMAIDFFPLQLIFVFFLLICGGYPSKQSYTDDYKMSAQWFTTKTILKEHY